MKDKLPIFNWSLKKLLDTEPDRYIRAKAAILYTLLIFTLIKVCVALFAGYYYDQDFQLARSLIFLGVIILLLKATLISIRYIQAVAVILIWMALSLVWSNVFIAAEATNIVTIQLVCMVILSSFYLLSWQWSMVYSGLIILPVLVTMTMADLTLTSTPVARLASPAFEIIVMLNFCSIIVAHYLYYRALSDSLLQKEILNQQLQLAVRDANNAATARADFLSTMSHELRTPLNSVIGMTELLLDSPYDRDQEENLKVVNFSAHNLHLLINDILDFNKLDSNKLIIEAINVDIHKLMKNISAGMAFQAREKGLVLELDIDERLHGACIITDPTRLTQIIHNLLGNAIKFTHEGKVLLTLRLLNAGERSVSIRFSVADTGIGISPDEQDVIFDIFTQASSSTTRNFGGTGLGLAIVKRLLVLFETDIEVKSTPGVGSEFSFVISFLRAGDTVASQDEPASLVYDLSDLRILVVEDNPLNSLLLQKMLSKWNNVPVLAANGEEALEMVADAIFDIILMDIHMPGLDGYETSQLIRNMPDPARSGIPIIALTASLSSQVVHKIKETGINDVLSKPFSSGDLLSKLLAIPRNGTGSFSRLEEA